MKTKPTIEEMVAAWQQCSGRIDDLSHRHDLTQVAFSPRPRERHILWRELGGSAVLAVAAVLALAIVLPPLPCQAASPGIDRIAVANSIHQILDAA